MTRIHRIGLVLLLALLSAAAFAQMPQFSADVVTTSPHNNMGPMKGKMYFSANKMRMETSYEGHQSIMISDLPSKTAYVLMPQERMYMEMNANMPMGRRSHGPEFRAYDPHNPCSTIQGATCKKVGVETVNGRSCEKWEITERNDKMTVWIDQKSKISIKTVHQDGSTVELKNIQEGPQPASLFQIPAGYTKMDMGGMMRGMPHNRHDNDDE